MPDLEKISRSGCKRLTHSDFLFQIGFSDFNPFEFSRCTDLEKVFYRGCKWLVHSVFLFQMGVDLEMLESPKYFLFQFSSRLYIDRRWKWKKWKGGGWRLGRKGSFLPSAWVGGIGLVLLVEEQPLFICALCETGVCRR